MIPTLLSRSVPVLIAALLLAVIWALVVQRASLQDKVKDQQTHITGLTGQLKTADHTISVQSGQILTLVSLSQAQAAEVAEQRHRLETITRNATARAVKLEAITHEDEAARAWGDTRLPPVVERLLDHDGTGGDTAGQADRDASLRTSNHLPDSGQPPEEQPPAGAEPAGNPLGS